jgi:hypothetical protein
MEIWEGLVNHLQNLKNQGPSEKYLFVLHLKHIV